MQASIHLGVNPVLLVNCGLLPGLREFVRRPVQLQAGFGVPCSCVWAGSLIFEARPM